MVFIEKECILLVQRFDFFFFGLKKSTIDCNMQLDRKKISTLEAKTGIYYHACAHYGGLWQGSIKINFYVSMYFLYLMFSGTVFISQLRQTLNRSGWFFPFLSEVTRTAILIQQLTIDGWRKRYISEPNVTEHFKFFMFLQLRETRWKSIKRRSMCPVRNGGAVTSRWGAPPPRLSDNIGVMKAPNQQ